MESKKAKAFDLIVDAVNDGGYIDQYVIASLTRYMEGYTYEYQCSDCGETQDEEFYSEIHACPKCDSSFYYGLRKVKS